MIASLAGEKSCNPPRVEQATSEIVRFGFEEANRSLGFQLIYWSSHLSSSNTSLSDQKTQIPIPFWFLLRTAIAAINPCHFAFDRKYVHCVAGGDDEEGGEEEDARRTQEVSLIGRLLLKTNHPIRSE